MWSTILFTLILCLSFCELGFTAKRADRAKSIDLNRSPSPENSPDNRSALSQRPNTQRTVFKRKSKFDKTSPAYQARQILDGLGHQKGSKEYNSIYRCTVRRIRDAQKKELAKVSEIDKADWEARKEKRRQYSREHRARIQQRKELNISTPEDLKFFQKNEIRQKKRYLSNPQKYRDRALQQYYKRKAAKKEAEKNGKDQEPDQNIQS
ncbi:uncharacterized protein FA14DRAFT_157005 [Meira miltonrushii]|uniref:Uncharacterized protein n=1 Tax=Meira miltonrushii TaxID=1280837 RepID=A0A316V9P7_9BASI|nr:uncharacterized protein FA14DRAFT_157005 [Meira miltonrushii]PWN34339.1 hypothetical protein FA14DRAFT_157005 [Meira miltonrushii]